MGGPIAVDEIRGDCCRARSVRQQLLDKKFLKGQGDQMGDKGKRDKGKREEQKKASAR